MSSSAPIRPVCSPAFFQGEKESHPKPMSGIFALSKLRRKRTMATERYWREQANRLYHDRAYKKCFSLLFQHTFGAKAYVWSIILLIYTLLAISIGISLHSDLSDWSLVLRVVAFAVAVAVALAGTVAGIGAFAFALTLAFAVAGTVALVGSDIILKFGCRL